ncbi:MAG: hypothetical protein KC431_20315 [Myxococcales bacterium]|nr:hypothetical protein [Myxococcales bacterium]
MAINQGEVPAAVAASVIDHDGRPDVVSFVDLNHPDNVCTQAEGPCPCYSDLNPNAFGTGGNIYFWQTFMVDFCDPLDLFLDTRWTDGVDQDDNKLVDDLVGYSFGTAEMEESHDGHHSETWHGTAILGIVGALGDNRPGGVNAGIISHGYDTLPDVNPGLAGLLWHVDLIPIGINALSGGLDIPGNWSSDGDEDVGAEVLDDGYFDFDFYEALEYAVAMDADIIVASVGGEFVRREHWLEASADFAPSETAPLSVLGGPDCKQTKIHTLDVDSKTFTAMMAGGKAWWGSVDLGDSVLFVGAGNCHMDLDHPEYERPLAEYLAPSQTASVAAMDDFPSAEPPLFASPAVEHWTVYGESVDLAAMTGISSLEGRSLSEREFGGTSAAAPHAAGIYGLFLLSRLIVDPNYLATHDAAEALLDFMSVSIDPERPTPGIGDGARFVNADRATGAQP